MKSGLLAMLRSNDLDRHLPTDGGLIGAVGDPARPVTDLLAQFVPTYRETRLGPGARHRGPGTGLERLVTGDDLLLELAQPRRRLDAELLAQP